MEPPPATKDEFADFLIMSNDGSLIKSAIPYLPLPVAVICLIVNIILPGVGKIQQTAEIDVLLAMVKLYF